MSCLRASATIGARMKALESMWTRQTLLGCAVVLWLVMASSQSLLAQCSNTWQGRPMVGLGSWVRCSAKWDPDGPGPLGEQLVLGGNFGQAGGVLAASIVQADPATGTFGAFGAGLNGLVRAVVPLPGGFLVAGGEFTASGAQPCDRVAVWNGTSWLPLGGGANGTVHALCVLANGDLIAGGEFTSIGGVAAARIARWNGQVWSPLGAGASNTVYALHEWGGGLVAGGAFASIGAAGLLHTGFWDGSSWQALGTAPASSSRRIYSFATLANGDLAAGGQWLLPPGNTSVAVWDGLSWQQLGSSAVWSEVWDLAVSAVGDVCAAGDHQIHRLIGSTWTEVGDPNGPTHVAEYLASDELVVAGRFGAIDGAACEYLARFDAPGWSPLAPGMASARLHAAAELPNGDLVVGGWLQVDGTPGNIARWDGAGWSNFGAGSTSTVHATAVAPNGDLFAGGRFDLGGATLQRLARWSGSVWLPVGNFPSGATVEAMSFLPNGDLVVCAGYPYRWDGSTWHSYPSGPQLGTASVAVRPNGNFVVARYWGGAILEWDGAQWSTLAGSLSGGVSDMCFDESGGLYVVGTLTAVHGSPVQHAAYWDGASWSDVGGGLPGAASACTMLPGGDLLVQCLDNGGQAMRRWNGSSWSLLNGSLAASSGDGWVNELMPLQDGRVLAIGQFAEFGGVAAGSMAWLGTTCPTTITEVGTGCVGSAGLVELQATTLPFVGTDWRARVTGIAPNSLAVAVYSFQPVAIPLSVVHPLGLPQCSLFVDDDILIDIQVASGQAQTTIVIPNQSSLIGSDFFHQVVPVELSGTGTITALTSSNTLRLTMGSF